MGLIKTLLKENFIISEINLPPSRQKQIIKDCVINIRDKYKQDESITDVEDLNNGYCEDMAYEIGDMLLDSGIQYEIVDDGLFWDSSNSISKYKTATGENWNVKNFKKYNTPFDYSVLSKIDLTGHSWIYALGLHFDVEVPEGVKSFLDLPIYQRQLK
mgnify:CR=1 FL=1|jgi:hypothetical protein